MNRFVTCACALLLAAAVVAAQEPAATTAAPAPTPAPTFTPAQSSYALGANFGVGMKQQEVPLDLEEFVRGFRAAYTGGTLEMSEEQIRTAVMTLQQAVMATQQAKRKEQAEKAKAEGEAFLAANQTKEGVVTLPSGLQYTVLAEGTGKSPADTDRVKVHYRGTLVDGTEFDSSYTRGEPAEMAVTGVIKGWTEALKLMKEGSKWRLFIPSNLAYGERGSRSIPPNSVLVFEVELLEVKAPAPPPKPATPAAPAPAAPAPTAPSTDHH